MFKGGSSPSRIAGGKDRQAGTAQRRRDKKDEEDNDELEDPTTENEKLPRTIVRERFAPVTSGTVRNVRDQEELGSSSDGADESESQHDEDEESFQETTVPKPNRPDGKPKEDDDFGDNILDYSEGGDNLYSIAEVAARAAPLPRGAARTPGGRASRAHGDPENTGPVGQQALMRAMLDQQMVQTGMRETQQMKQSRLAAIVRTSLFKKVKFCLPEQMGATGRIAARVYKKMGYDSKAQFLKDWETWLSKHVRNACNEKRSAVTQAIHKSIVKGSGSCCCSLFSTLFLVLFYGTCAVPNSSSTFLYSPEKWWKGVRIPLPDKSSCSTLLTSKRSNLVSYFWFYDDVLSCVVGRKHWRDQSINTKGTKIATVSDEALGLLIVENCWASWCARSNGPDGPLVLASAFTAASPELGDLAWENMTKEQQDEARKTRAKEVLGLAKYTTKETGKKETSGWSKEGINRFNTLCQEVVANRVADKGNFDEYYLNNKLEAAGGKKRKRAADLDTVTAYLDNSD